MSIPSYSFGTTNNKLRFETNEFVLSNNATDILNLGVTNIITTLNVGIGTGITLPSAGLQVANIFPEAAAF